MRNTANSTTSLSPAERKAILRDPLAAFERLFGEPQSAAIDSAHLRQQINRLWEAIGPLRQQIRELQEDSKKTSRQLGQAKKSGDDARVRHLLEHMKDCSARLKPLQAQIQAQEQQLLQLFASSAAEGEQESRAPQAENNDIRHYPPAPTTATENIRICELSGDASAWDAYVQQHPHGCIHHRSAWAQVFRDTYGHRCYQLQALDADDRLCGLLPMLHLDSRLFGKQLVSMPYFQRGGALGDSPAIEQALMQAAAELALRLQCEHIEYRDDSPRSEQPELAVQTHKVNMVLKLPASREALWQGFGAKLRSQIRRAQREQPEIRFGGEELLADFYRVYSRNMRDLGSPVHSRELIRHSLRAFPGQSFLAVAYHRQQPVSAGFLLQDGDNMEIPLASTIRRVTHLSMNMFLYHEVLQFAIERGCGRFDFGRSSRGAGTYQFKKQWGARPKPLYWHYWLPQAAETNPASAPQGMNPDSPKYRLVIAAWKRLPLPLSRWLGPKLVRNIP